MLILNLARVKADLFLPGMQGKDKPARGTTSEEFMGHMLGIQAATDSKWDMVPNKSEWHGRHDARYSFDNPSIHEKAVPELERLGFERVPLPTYSPDMHKVIEHVHANIGREFRKKLIEDASIKKEQYASILEEIFFNITQASIAKDVMSLPDTYEEIKRLQGNWPSYRFR